jgi:hypothetical protein
MNMRKHRNVEEIALERATRGNRARRVGPQPPISDDDLAMNAALNDQECFPSNAPKPPLLSRLAALFSTGPSDVAGDGGDYQ